MQIITSKFTISAPQVNDIQSLVNLYNDKEVMKYIPNNLTNWSEQDVNDKINRFKYREIGIHVVKLIDDTFIGEASIFKYNGVNNYEIGFIISKEFWGRGLGVKYVKFY